MASIVVNGDTSGSVTLSAPAVAGTVAVTLPSASGTMAVSGGSPSFTTVTTTSDASISGLTVGKGGSAVSTSTAVGASALTANTTGGNNVAIGYQAGLAQSTGGQSTFVGSQAGLAGADIDYATAVGYQAMSSITTGDFNTALGAQALKSNTTASNGVAVGYQASYSRTTGDSVVAIGKTAGYSGVSSVSSTFVGTNAGYYSTGSYNSFFGQGAGEAVTSGTKNTIIGRYDGNIGGLDIRTASNYVVLSDGDGNPVGYYQGNNQTWVFGQGGTGYTGDGSIVLNGAAPAAGNGAYIGGQSNGTAAWAIGSYRAVISGTNTWFTCQNSGGGGVYLNGASATSWTAVSDETRKVIIEPITDGLNKVSTLRTVIGRLKTDEESVRRPYLIAQDVQAVLPEAVSEAEDKDGSVLGLSYTEVIPLLVASIKELKTIVDAQSAEIDTVKAELAALKG
jgi:hypothetical protein